MEHRTIKTPSPSSRRPIEGAGVSVERHNVAWPFDPAQPKPRPQTWRNRRRIAIRYVMEHRHRWVAWVVDKALYGLGLFVTWWVGIYTGLILRSLGWF